METGDSWALVVAKASGAVAAAAGTGKAVLNTLKAVGPYVVAQWDQASLAQAKHNARLAVVETGKDFLKQELCNYSEVSKHLLSEYVAATPKRKLLIQKDLEYLAQRVRQINIGILAIGYAQTYEDNTEMTRSEGQVEVSPHWVDKFNELARSHNEGWRAELLARALATESSSPGTVSPRALWFLGTLEEPIFRAFATILDLCATFGNDLAVPQHDTFHKRIIPDSSYDRTSTLGGLLFLLGETSFLADGLTCSMTFEKGVRIVSYGSEHYLISSPNTILELRGILLSKLGQSVASFCERKPCMLGREVLEAWFESLDKSQHTITPVVRVEANWYPKSDVLIP